MVPVNQIDPFLPHHAFGFDECFPNIATGEIRLIGLMLTIGYFKPFDEAWEQEYTKDVYMTPWKYFVYASVFLVIIVLMIYT